jgi:hypothetical protein
VARDPEHHRMLDGRDLFDPEPCGRGRWQLRRERGSVRTLCDDVRGRPDGLAGNDHEACVEGIGIDRDRVRSVVDLEGDRLAAVVDGLPSPAGPNLESRSAEDERLMGLALEFGLGIDPATNAHIAWWTIGEPPSLADPDLRRDGEQSSDAIPRAERPEDHRPCAERDETDDQGEQGGHGADDSAGNRKARRNLPDTWALM